MKKILFSIISLLLIFIITFFVMTNKKEEKNKKVVVAEVTHSIFYAPQYVAYKKGYFKDEGLDVEFMLTPGANNVTAAVLSKEADIGFAGSEASIYVYSGGEKDYLVNFAGLTKRDGSFLVSRKKMDNFNITDLKNKTIIGGRKAGMPAMTLKYSLKENGLDPNKDVNVDTSIDFAAMSGAFIGGTGDFVTLFEPSALALEKASYGHVVASVGELGGVVPYTAYSARKCYIKNNEDVIKSFNKAINKGLDFVHNNTDKEVAKVIQSEFPDTSLNDIIKVVKRYREIDAWFDTTYIEEENFKKIMEIMKSDNELDKEVPFKDLVNNKFSTK